MESVLGRYKNLIVLACVLVVQVLGLAMQVKRTTDTESTSLIRIWAVNSITPFEKVLNWVHGGSWNLWHNYFYLRGVRAENRELKAEIERLRLEQVRLNEDAAQARRLQALFGFKEQFISSTLAAQVIGTGGSEQSRVIYIDKGSHSGVKSDMAVITVDGIVGKVLKVFGSTSQVLLIDDQSSGVGGILDKSRLQGIVRGTSSGEVMLEHIMSDNAVHAGEEVRTSGGDRIFPKGLPVGTVKEVNPGSDLFLNIRVRPAANLNKLEEVLVVTKLVEQEPTQLEAGAQRAVDILAQRLPSVPDKNAQAEAAKSQPSANTAAAASTPTTALNKAAPEATAAKPVNATKPKETPAAQTQAGVVPAKPITPAPKPASAPPSPLKSATEHGPAPAPVQVANPSLPGAKPKAAPAVAQPGETQSTQPQDGPQ